jgi:hypothetical protein
MLRAAFLLERIHPGDGDGDGDDGGNAAVVLVLTAWGCCRFRAAPEKLLRAGVRIPVFQSLADSTKRVPEVLSTETCPLPRP